MQPIPLNTMVFIVRDDSTPSNLFPLPYPPLQPLPTDPLHRGKPNPPPPHAVFGETMRTCLEVS